MYLNDFFEIIINHPKGFKVKYILEFMVVIKEVSASSIQDSRDKSTILVKIKTDIGNFSASSPSGTSTGKYEAKCYKKDLEGDIKRIKEFKEYFSNEILEKFNDLRRVEDIVDGHVGGNTVFALESAILKAIAKEQKKQVWEIINPNAKKFPRLVGNCIGGGKHSEKFIEKVPDFQEFLLIPNKGSVKENFKTNTEIHKKIKQDLKEKDKKFKGQRNYEGAWVSSLNEKEILDLLKKFDIPLGLDVAASGYYKRKKYYYKNPKLIRTIEEQAGYINNVIKNYNLFYIEDAFEETDFDSFANMSEKFPNKLIVGDDLIVTNPKRLKKAIEKKSVTSIIVKPNQIGSLIEVERVCKMCRENNIKMVFSHRSGETTETILADLAFGFQSDFLKCGISGKTREAKIKRLIEIEKSFK